MRAHITCHPEADLGLAPRMSCRGSMHTKLRVALVCLVWGEEFADFFARYCVRSLLEPHNIPLLAREQDVTLLLYTDRATQEFLDRS